MTTLIHLSQLVNNVWTTVHGYGPTGSKPAASSSNVGYLYYDTTLIQLQRSNGSSWDLLSYGGGAALWGSITGTLSSQTDLSTALAGKQAADAGLTSLAGLTGTGYIKATATDTYSLTTTIPWSDLSSVPSTFAPAAHVLDSAAHTISGKTAGQALIATSATAYAFTAIGGDATLDGSGTLTVAAAAISLSKMANLAANSVIGNNTGSSAVPIALTQTQLTAMVNTFTSALSGTVAASGGGTTNFLRADGTWTAPVGTFSGSLGANQIAVGSASNTISGSASLTATTTSAALLFLHAANTSSATTATTAATHTVSFSGAATTGPMVGLASTVTANATFGTAGVQIIGGLFRITSISPGSAVAAVSYVGSQSQVTTGSAANTNFASASIFGGQSQPTFSNAAISGTTLAALVGYQVSPSIVMAPASGGATITAIYGVWVKPGTFSTATVSTTTTVTNYYGLYLDTVTTTGSGTTTLTNRYGVYQADTSASNFFAGGVTCANLTDSGLTSGRVTFAGTAGLLSDNSGFLYGTNTLTVSNAAGSAAMVLGGTAGNARDFQFQTAGVLRFILRTNGTAEAGSNSGSDWQLLARDDTGAAIDAPISITRAAGGAISLLRPLTNTQSGVFGASALLATERLRVAGGTMGTPGATDVLIAAGAISCGAGLTVAGASGLAAVVSSGTVAGDYIYKIANASGTGLGLRVQAGADANIALAVRNTAGSATPFTVLGSGAVTIQDATATSIQTAGGITAGLSITLSRGAAAIITNQCTAAGTANYARTVQQCDTTAKGYSDCYSSTFSGSIFGTAAANATSFLSDGASLTAFFVGVYNVDKPLILGINSSEVARFTGGTLSTQSLAIKYTTASSSTTTGALTVAGGVGVAGSLNVGDTSTINSTSNVSLTLGRTSAANEVGMQFVPGAGTIRNWKIVVSATLSDALEFIPSTTNGGTTYTTPAFQIVGASGQVKVATTTASTSTTTGALTVAGGIGWALDAFGGGKIVSVSPTAGVGYATGAGGTVTQTTSRATGVTLNKVTGQITLVSAAGSASWQSFDVTNSTVATTDTIILSQVSGTDQYILQVVRVNAGSFRVAFATNGGTTTEQPVIQFNVIKGATS